MTESLDRPTTTPDLAAPALLLLFAADVLPPVHFSLGQLFGANHDVHLPCSRGRVALGPLEAHLFAWSFWQLHHDGAIRLDHDGSVPRGRKLDWLGLDALATRTGDRAPRSNMLEEQILDVCSVEPMPVSKVIVEWGKQRGVRVARWVFLPLEAIIDEVHEDACLGFGLEPTPLSRSNLNCGDIDTSRPAFEALRVSWGTFVDEDHDRADALLRCCDAGLAQLRPPKYGAVLGGI